MNWPAPGIHENIPFADYLELDAVSSSFLKRFRANPAGALMPFEQTPDMQLGSAIHAYGLEGPAAFGKQYTVLPASTLNKNSNDYKAQKAEFMRWAAGQNLEILPSDYAKVPTMDIIQGSAAALHDHPIASRILASGRRELSLVWEDAETGLLCKARIDHDPGRSTLVDLKKTASVGKFKNQICDLSYDVQAGTYAEGADELGIKADTFIFLAVEAKPPYPVRCVYLSDQEIEVCDGKFYEGWLTWSRREAHRLLRLVYECKERNVWPSYQIPPHIQTLDDLSPETLLEELAKPPWR